MKKIVGIALMVALLGFNAYLWPTLIHAVKTDGRTDTKKTASLSQKAGTAKPAMDLANQGPRAANVSAYPVEKSVAVSASVPAPAQKQSEGKPKTKAIATAKTNTPKKKTQKTKTATKPVKKQTARPPVNNVPTYPAWDDNGLYVVDDGGPGSSWVRLSDGSLLRKSDGTRTFNMPYDKNPFTGEIKPTVEPMSEAAYKMWKGNQAQQPSPFSPSPFGR
ncbi:hypothetical protein [Brevibacillus sp. Leaf182]|uniref:hypothetical protein n=1 Tax=Brevibacillus sp. Leaf182 TaxID=1736290 RepID=UPI000700641E|nr:hypothetical protein [Brevibacillus sp. Leaf182]RAT96803.1 hypothetical protein ASG16_014010 [Brevibacillus sp. Leaf182]